MQKSSSALSDLFAGYYALGDADRLRRIQQYVRSLTQYVRSLTRRFPFDTAVLVIAAITEGTDLHRLSSVSGRCVACVKRVADRMAAAGLWFPDGSVDYAFLAAAPGKERELEFTDAVLIAGGMLAWTGEKKNGRKVYEITEAGWACLEGKLGGSSAIQ